MPPTAGSSTAEPARASTTTSPHPSPIWSPSARCTRSARCPEWIPVSVGGRRRSAARRRSPPTRRTSSAAPPRSALMQLRWPEPFPADARPGRCSPRPTRSGSAAAWRSRSPRCARRSRPGVTCPSRDNVLIAAAACEMHPTRGDQGRRAGEHAQRALDEAQRAGARPTASTRVPAIWIDGARAVRRAGDPGRDAGQPRLRADRPPPGTLLPPVGRARAGRGDRDRHRRGRSSSGTPARATRASSPAPCAPTSRSWTRTSSSTKWRRYELS